MRRQALRSLADLLQPGHQRGHLRRRQHLPLRQQPRETDGAVRQRRRWCAASRQAMRLDGEVRHQAGAAQRPAVRGDGVQQDVLELRPAQARMFQVLIEEAQVHQQRGGDAARYSIGNRIASAGDEPAADLQQAERLRCGRPRRLADVERRDPKVQELILPDVHHRAAQVDADRCRREMRVQRGQLRREPVHERTGQRDAERSRAPAVGVNRLTTAPGQPQRRLPPFPAGMAFQHAGQRGEIRT